jgi:CRISPR/Cas system-associated exonuclease Cas4 (RecB family)
MATKRAYPYIWVTWLSSIMSGDNPCKWQPWFKANYKMEKEQPSDFDLTSWKIKHTRLLTELSEELELVDGIELRIEEELKFTFEETQTILAGKADCICKRSKIITIYECKTGKERESDKVQVMIYMWLLSNDPRTSNHTILGEVVYSDKRVRIAKLDESFESDLLYFVKLLSRKKPPQKSPGSACKICKITSDDCDKRID